MVTVSCRFSAANLPYFFAGEEFDMIGDDYKCSFSDFCQVKCTEKENKKKGDDSASEGKAKVSKRQTMFYFLLFKLNSKLEMLPQSLYFFRDNDNQYRQKCHKILNAAFYLPFVIN